MLNFTTLRDNLQTKLNESKGPTDLVLCFNVHGLGPIIRYIDMNADPWRLIPSPSPVASRGS